MRSSWSQKHTPNPWAFVASDIGEDNVKEKRRCHMCYRSTPKIFFPSWMVIHNSYPTDQPIPCSECYARWEMANLSTTP
jgi:hypothetical protein